MIIKFSLIYLKCKKIHFNKKKCEWTTDHYTKSIESNDLEFCAFVLFVKNVCMQNFVQIQSPEKFSCKFYQSNRNRKNFPFIVFL